MRPKTYFKPGQAVIADSFDHQKIIGIFHSHSNSFGVYIKGRPVDSSEPERLHKCLKLTLKHVQEPTKSQILPTFIKGQACSGFTPYGEKISGFFVQAEGKYAWIKGWPPGRSKFDPQETFKITRKTLKPS